ncbi:octopamine receptor beta-2R-like [Oculina patagonica]
MWFLILGWLFTVIGILGNAIVMYLIITRRRLHVTANWFVLSLALADLSVELSYFPLLFISTFFHNLSTDHAGLWFKISHTFLYSSSANLCALTVDRLLAIEMHLKYTLLITRRRLFLFLAMAWITPIIVFTLPSIFTYSSGNDSFTFIFETFRVLIFQLIPSILFVVVIGRLFFIAKRISRKELLLLAQIRFNLGKEEKVEGHNKHTEKKASVKIIILIILFFVLCHIAGNYRCFCFVFKLCVVPEPLKEVIHIFFVLNSAMNPFVYAVLKKDIKRELKRMGCHY